MPSIKFRRGKAYGADMAAYMLQIENISPEETEHERLVNNLIRCIREDVTPRQREVLVLYYVRRMKHWEIAEQLGLERSTVSRTIKRGEDKLRRCLRYGARRYLRDASEGDGENKDTQEEKRQERMMEL